MTNSTSLPLVSVVIPAWNAERWVDRAVRSVLAQDYRPIEILVVDDGSTDGTVQALSRYGSQIRVLPQVHGGVSAARNGGIAAAQGEWIGFLDADDEYLPNKVSLLMSAVLRQPGFQAVTGTYRVTKADGTPDEASTPCTPEGGADELQPLNVFERWSQSVFIPHTNTSLVRKSILQLVGGFRGDLVMGEDLEMWSRIDGACGWGFLNRPVAVYYRDPVSSVTLQKPWVRTNADFLYDASDLRRWIAPARRGAYRRFRQHMLIHHAVQLARQGQRKDALRAFLRGAPPPFSVAYFIELLRFLVPLRRCPFCAVFRRRRHAP